MKFKLWILTLTGTFLMFSSSPSEALIIINEVLADPHSVSGDANGDGIVSGIQDEFIELLNYGSSAVDISGWSLTDAIKKRHSFFEDTVLNPYEFFVVFGGGSPALPGINWQTASTGSLGLNNSGDTITLFDINSVVIDQVVYGDLGNKNQSLTRFPDGIGKNFLLHSKIEQVQGALFSPGQSIDGKSINSVTTPELPVWLYFFMGCVMILVKRYQFFSQVRFN